MITSIDHIELIVRDVDEYVRFFEALGFEVLQRTSHHVDSVEMSLPGENQTVFEIHTVSGEENVGVNHIAFKVDDVREAHEELSAKGINFARGPHLVKSTGRTNANLRDPDGWRLQLVDSRRGSPQS